MSDETFCAECGAPLDEGKIRWCSTKCAQRVYARARSVAFNRAYPLNTECKWCGDEVPPGKWFCAGTDCSAQWRAEGNARPSRYDQPEFFKTANTKPATKKRGTRKGKR